MQGVYKHTLDSLHIAIAVHVVGLQIACLGPLVPAVDGDERHLTGMLVGIGAGMNECLQKFSGVLLRVTALLFVRGLLSQPMLT